MVRVSGSKMRSWGAVAGAVVVLAGCMSEPERDPIGTLSGECFTSALATITGEELDDDEFETLRLQSNGDGNYRTVIVEVKVWDEEHHFTCQGIRPDESAPFVITSLEEHP